MAQYTGIQGQNILITSSDPSNPTEGQIWYNSTTNLLKGYQNFASNSWATGGNLNTARKRLGAAGTQTAALAFGGNINPPIVASTESYNGSSWTNTTSMSTARTGLGGSGTQTSALGFGGSTNTGPVTNTEEWTGTETLNKTVMVS